MILVTPSGKGMRKALLDLVSLLREGLQQVAL
jgi:hypothetical protein